MLVGALSSSSNSTGMRFDKSTGKKCIHDRSWKGVDLDHFEKMGLPRAAIYQVCQCIETRKTAKKMQKADDKQ